MYVAQFEITPDPNHALRPVPHTSLASLNTHDTPTFAGWWQGLDIQDRIELGLLEAAAAGGEHNHRAALRHALSEYFGKPGGSGNFSTEQGVRRACLEFLGSSPAELVLLNLEDLWGELRPQNVPGTTSERPNWQRKARYALEEFCQMPDVLDTLKELDRRRKKREGGGQWRKNGKRAPRSKPR
jgi:4-alpha-glucanotransferase